jgi:hypothetical protein
MRVKPRPLIHLGQGFFVFVRSPTLGRGPASSVVIAAHATNIGASVACR